MKNLLKLLTIVIIIMIPFGFNSCKKSSSNEWFMAGDKPNSYITSRDNLVFQNGKQSAYIESTESKIAGFGTLMQTCSAKEYLGKKVKMTGFVKTENLSDWAGMWLRIDPLKAPSSKYFDNMRDRQLKETTNWTKCEIILDIPTNSNTMNFGVLIHGTGKVWFDNISFEILEESAKKFNDSLNIGISKKQLLPKPTNLNFEI